MLAHLQFGVSGAATDLGCAAATWEAEAEDPTETPRYCAPSDPAAGSG